MLRVVLLGSLGSLAIAPLACSSHGAAPAAQAGAPAGQVVTVAGTVTAQRGSAARRLAQGDTVAADDVIDTGSDGNVVIVLARNHVEWKLGPGQHQRPDESTAWGLPVAQAPAKPADLDTAAAGRPAERQAADTLATAHVGAAPSGGAASAASAEAPAPEKQIRPVAVTAPGTGAPRRRSEGAPAKKTAAPADDEGLYAPAPAAAAPPTAPPPAPPSSAVPNMGPTASAPASPIHATHAPQGALAELLAQHLAELRACRSTATSTLQITLDVDALGHVTRTVRGDAAEQRCVQRVLRGLTLPPGHATLDVK